MNQLQPQPSKMVWIVRINPNGSWTYFTSRGKMTERRAIGFCRSWQAYYDKEYSDMGFRFITTDKDPKQLVKEEPMLYWVYNSIGSLTNDGPVRFDLARRIINEHDDYTMSEAC